MALTDEELQKILDKLTTREQKQLYDQLSRTFQEPLQTASNKETGMSSTKAICCCVYCGSTDYIKHGFSPNKIQRYQCKACKKTFSENHGHSLRYSHMSESEWREILRGFVEEQSITNIAKNIGCSTKTVWLAKQKVNQALMTMYGYTSAFNGTIQADEYYTRASFKGKRDPEFFIYTLRRMPRHNYNYYEKIQWLEKAGLYDRLQREEPDFLEELLSDKPKMKRGISNEQICILTLIDDAGSLYLEPVSVGRLEKAMAKQKLRQKISSNKDNVIVTDEHGAYKRITYGTGARHEVVKADKHTNGKYSLAKVNSVHSALSGYMDSKKGKVFNTKYLDLTLMLFWWLQQYKKYTTNQKVEILYAIMTDDISDLAVRERVNQVTEGEIMNREITLDTKNKFPKKL